ncbi:MAG TPA: allophanate hydrolase [Stellaceae bacterium]|nr:allophanate hydrolase [Stellaceae bacterium]
MIPSLDFHSLAAAYAGGAATPSEIAREVVARIAARGDDGVWISRVLAERLAAAAAALERLPPDDRGRLPLYGIPFAVKDNIDVEGVPTTAACPALAYVPARTAPCVQRLVAAGALFVGKTNLDQFATGLVGTRSPYGVARNPFDPAYIPGGSSSGSAVAVSAGLVSFALGTDTAGSGRVPAGFNNIVGLKPTRGLVGTAGVVPACRSLDCVSVFALTVADAARVVDVARGSPGDPEARAMPPGFGVFGEKPARFKFAVPAMIQREFFGNADAERLFAAAVERLETLGGTAVEIDFAPFLEVASLLYDGPWLAERAAAIDDAVDGRRDVLHPVTRRIVDGADRITAADVFHGQDRLAALAQATAAVWRENDLLLLPTSGTIFSIAEIEAEPVARNAMLGRYTNFTNLLDLAALAVPNGFYRNGLPAGITLLAPAFHDPLLAAIGAAFQRHAGLSLGATGAALPPQDDPAAVPFPYLPLAVFGAHLSGMPLNSELLGLGARLRRTMRTAPVYRLYVLPDGKRPGLVRRPHDGVAIDLEVWDVPMEAVGTLLADIAPPLGLGTIALEDGGAVRGFLCEAHAAGEARDISAFGGWRAWQASRA